MLQPELLETGRQGKIMEDIVLQMGDSDVSGAIEVEGHIPTGVVIVRVQCGADCAEGYFSTGAILQLGKVFQDIAKYVDTHHEP